jgi:hypothetical protein
MVGGGMNLQEISRAKVLVDMVNQGAAIINTMSPGDRELIFAYNREMTAQKSKDDKYPDLADLF